MNVGTFFVGKSPKKSTFPFEWILNHDGFLLEIHLSYQHKIHNSKESWEKTPQKFLLD